MTASWEMSLSKERLICVWFFSWGKKDTEKNIPAVNRTKGLCSYRVFLPWFLSTLSLKQRPSAVAGFWRRKPRAVRVRGMKHGKQCQEAITAGFRRGHGEAASTGRCLPSAMHMPWQAVGETPPPSSPRDGGREEEEICYLPLLFLSPFCN